MADRGRNCVVFIVEGDSDRIALEQPMTALFDIIDETIKVVFCKPGILGGDITSLSGVNQNNIVEKLIERIKDELYHVKKVFPENILEFIQIVDTDGAYLDPSSVVSADPEHLEVHDPYYNAERLVIESSNPEGIRARNENKRNNLDRLIRLTEISMQGNSIPYNVYYFSSNIDHFLHNEPNTHSKTLLAKSFSANYIWDPKGFAEFFVFDDYATKCEEFLDSWCEVKTEGNSIKCGTNINILMKDLLRQVK